MYCTYREAGVGHGLVPFQAFFVKYGVERMLRGSGLGAVVYGMANFSGAWFGFSHIITVYSVQCKVYCVQ